MPKWRMGTAGVCLILFATLLPNEAPARPRLGINPVGVARMAVIGVLSLGRVRHARAHARRGNMRTAALRPRDIRTMDAGLADPAARRQIVAMAALAGLPKGVTTDRRGRRSDGGYGWVGPLFWPFAIYDIHDYAILGDGTGFWSYGYPDIHAGIFAPYGRVELAAYTAARPSGRRHRSVPPLQFLCGEDSREAGGRLTGQIQQAIQPNNEAQRAALDDLAQALITAAEMIRATCPAQAVMTAPERLASMQQRIGAMVMAEQALMQPLVKFYDLLDEEQEARLNAIVADRRRTSAEDGNPEATAKPCRPAQPAALPWPPDIEARLRLNEAQRAALKALQDANATAMGLLDACPPTDTTTPPARLDAVNARLGAMQQAVYLVGAALGDFYATLSDEQKAQFEAIGQKRTG